MRNLALISCLLLLLVGCSTPQTRIEKNPEAFAKIPAEQQALVARGEIAVDFDQTMVLLAWGKPDRKKTRVSEEEIVERWIYLGYRTRYVRTPLSSFHGDYRCGHGHYSPLFAESTYRDEYEKASVDFDADRVVAFEAPAE